MNRTYRFNATQAEFMQVIKNNYSLLKISRGSFRDDNGFHVLNRNKDVE